MDPVIIMVRHLLSAEGTPKPEFSPSLREVVCNGRRLLVKGMEKMEDAKKRGPKEEQTLSKKIGGPG